MVLVDLEPDDRIACHNVLLPEFIAEQHFDKLAKLTATAPVKSARREDYTISRLKLIDIESGSQNAARPASVHPSYDSSKSFRARANHWG